MKIETRITKMKIRVKSTKLLKGVNAVGERYCFSSVLVISDDGKHADYVNVDESVCKPDKIKPGVIAEMYVSSKNEKQATIFDIKRDAPSDAEVPASNIDESTGEVIGYEPPLPEPPAEVLAGHERDKAKHKNNKS